MNPEEILAISTLYGPFDTRCGDQSGAPKYDRFLVFLEDKRSAVDLRDCSLHLCGQVKPVQTMKISTANTFIILPVSGLAEYRQQQRRSPWKWNSSLFLEEAIS